MTLTRREFLWGTAGAAAGAAILSRLADARGLLTDPTLDQLIQRTLAAAKKAGATYADLRIVRRRTERVSTREDHVVDVGADESYGLGVRVIAQGAWGFAASSRVEAVDGEKAAVRAVDIAKASSKVLERPVQLAPTAAHVDVWQTSLTKDPFKIPLADKAELLLAANAEILKVPGVKYASSFFSGLGEWKLFASSEGASIEQNITRIFPGLEATAVDTSSGDFQSRTTDAAPVQAGWEYVEELGLPGLARRVGEEAVEKLKGAAVRPGRRDLILDATNLWLTIHESVGHPTELDRALGYEANMAGTSFATVDKLGKLRYASPIVTIYADKTTPRALATCGYDDDGVKTQRWDLVKNGLFVGYQTTREQAGWIGEKESRGTSYAQDHRSFPFQRMPNVSLAPGKKDLAAKDLIAATDDGVYVVGRGSWSIDHQRYNFQFGGQMFYEVKHGRKVRALRDVAYQANSLDFWNSCDLIGGARAWQMGGSFYDGKGEPLQINAVSHGCAPARFRQINVLDTKTRKG
jgi:TldD protein